MNDQEQHAQSARSELLTVKQVVKLLGASPRWVRGEIASGRLPVIRLGASGRMIRIRQEALDAFIAERERS